MVDNMIDHISEDSKRVLATELESDGDNRHHFRIIPMVVTWIPLLS
jgi:hypothetical protein